ncbi:MAG: ATP-binding protein [Cyclobacteriaceae bacterium]|nr:ATP-binding protein [Cyclobacteriaceae bacterium]
MQYLSEISDRLILNTNVKYIRPLYNKINWDQRLVEIRGSRGVGKTTLLLQYAKAKQTAGESVLYASLDNAWFFKHKLTELADEFFKYGGKYLLLDEVHKYPHKEQGVDWSQELKNIYDSYPGLYIVYTGSSILHLYRGIGDLSRRKSTYRMFGLSFREYLNYNNIADFAIVPFNDLIENHMMISRKVIEKIRILPHFKKYLIHGYYPFSNLAGDKYFDQLNEVINVIVETDIPSVSDISFETSSKLKKLFYLLAESVPYTPNLSKLSGQLHIADSRTLLKYLNYLEKAELIQTLGAKATGNQVFNKPEKIYLDNTNLMYALSPAIVNDGTLREVFAVNQLKQLYEISYPSKGDLMVNQQYVLEIGGKNKNYKQVADMSDAYIFNDNMESGFGKNIPLWLLGFLN